MLQYAIILSAAVEVVPLSEEEDVVLYERLRCINPILSRRLLLLLVLRLVVDND